MEPGNLTLEDVVRYVVRHGPARGEDIGAALGYPWAAETVQRRLASLGDGPESFLCASKAGWYTRAPYENEDAAIAGCGERHAPGEPSECNRCGTSVCAL